jgi:hypothetical protein
VCFGIDQHPYYRIERKSDGGRFEQFSFLPSRTANLLEGGVLVLAVEFEFKLGRWSLNCLFFCSGQQSGGGGTGWKDECRDMI